MLTCYDSALSASITSTSLCRHHCNAMLCSGNNVCWAREVQALSVTMVVYPECVLAANRVGTVQVPETLQPKLGKRKRSSAAIRAFLQQPSCTPFDGLHQLQTRPQQLSCPVRSIDARFGTTVSSRAASPLGFKDRLLSVSPPASSLTSSTGTPSVDMSNAAHLQTPLASLSAAHLSGSVGNGLGNWTLPDSCDAQSPSVPPSKHASVPTLVPHKEQLLQESLWQHVPLKQANVVDHDMTSPSDPDVTSPSIDSLHLTNSSVERQCSPVSPWPCPSPAIAHQQHAKLGHVFPTGIVSGSLPSLRDNSHQDDRVLACSGDRVADTPRFQLCRRVDQHSLPVTGSINDAAHAMPRRLPMWRIVSPVSHRKPGQNSAKKVRHSWQQGTTPPAKCSAQKLSPSVKAVMRQSAPACSSALPDADAACHDVCSNEASCPKLAHVPSSNEDTEAQASSLDANPNAQRQVCNGVASEGRQSCEQRHTDTAEARMHTSYIGPKTAACRSAQLCSEVSAQRSCHARHARQQQTQQPVPEQQQVQPQTIMHEA